MPVPPEIRADLPEASAAGLQKSEGLPPLIASSIYKYTNGEKK